MSETVKAHKQSKELLASAVSKDAASGNQPFRKGPTPRKQHFWGQSSYKHNSKQKSLNFNWSNKRNAKYANEYNLFQGDINSGSTRKVTICSQVGKKIILVGSTPKYPDGRKTKTLCKKVAISNKGSGYFRNCEGISNSFSFSTPATAVAKGISSQSKRKICSGGGDRKSLEKGCNRKSSYEKGFCKKSVYEQFISTEEKGWGQQACHQFEESKSVHPSPSFKMESLQ